MILILSSQEDFSTNEVIDWIYFFKFQFLRISKEDLITLKDIEFGLKNEVNFSVGGRDYKLSDFRSFWYRRSNFTFKFENYVFFYR